MAMPHCVHRVFSAFVAALAVFMALTSMGWPYVADGVVMLLAVWCWLNEFRYPQHITKIGAIGYGLVLALILLKGFALFGYREMSWRSLPNQSELWDRPWIGEMLIGVVGCYVVWHLLKRYRQIMPDRLSIMALLGTVLLCVVSMKVQGITVGMVIMLLGFAGANRVLLGLGVVSLLFYISSYYYLLDATLLDKAQILLVVGLVLLALRWLMLLILPVKKEVKHA